MRGAVVGEGREIASIAPCLGAVPAAACNSRVKRHLLRVGSACIRCAWQLALIG